MYSIIPHTQRNIRRDIRWDVSANLQITVDETTAISTPLERSGDSDHFRIRLIENREPHTLPMTR